MPDDVGFGSSSAHVCYEYEPSEAIEHLEKRDRRLARLIRRVGEFRLESRAHLTPYQALLRAIVYQQLSGSAARKIEQRLKVLFPSRRASAKRLLALSDRQLRECGLSFAKIRAARDLSEKTLSGAVPHRRQLRAMSDDEIIERLSSIRGIGRWSVEMLLIFHMGRADVLPVGDLGIRRGHMLHRGLDQMPTPRELAAHGERWRPYRSVASWYLWRASDLEWPSIKSSPRP